MKSLNDYVREYNNGLRKGEIQKAYRGIFQFIQELKLYLEKRHPMYTISSIYPGYMDMTYFAFTPRELKDKGLKIAVVYLHIDNRFEAWLGGANRKLQAEYINKLTALDLNGYHLSEPGPGVDSIVEVKVAESPNFDNIPELVELIEDRVLSFAQDMVLIIKDLSEKETKKPRQ